MTLSERRGREPEGPTAGDDWQRAGFSWGWGIGFLCPGSFLGEEALSPLTTHLCWSLCPSFLLL